MNKHPLVDVLVKLDELHQELLELSLNKTEVLISNHLEEFEKIVLNEQKLIVLIRQEEEKRERLAREIVKGSHAPSISDCIDVIEDKEIIDKLLGLKNALIDKITLIKEKTALNEQLIKQSLYFINQTLSFIQPTNQVSNYQASGQPTMNKPQAGSSMFDSKA